jgi:hypothetical protein
VTPACARVPDLIGLDWPPARLGGLPQGTYNEGLALRLPLRRAGYERARSPEREPLVLKGRRGERMRFGGAGRNARQSPGLGYGHGGFDLA